MTIYAVYDTSTGVINQIRNSFGSSIVVDSSESYIEVDDTISDGTYRIDLSTQTPELKTDFPVATTYATTVNTTLSFTGIPTDAQVEYAAEDGSTTSELIYLDISDGTLDFTTDLAGTYTLVFTSPLYLGVTTVITVTD